MRAGLLLVLVLLSGCATPTSTLAPLPPPLATVELPATHDHHEAEGHDLADGLERVAGVSLKEMVGDERVRASDIQFHGDLAAITLNGGSGGFVLLDMADPMHPAVLGRYRSGTNDNWYTKFSPDGRYVILTANAAVAPTTGLVDGLAAVPRGEAPSGAVQGLHLVDVHDPTRPTLASVFPWPVRVVNVAVTLLHGETIVFASIVVEQAGASHENFVQILRIVDGRFEPLARWTPAAPEGKLVFFHDLYVEEHPVASRTVLSVAAWDAGAYFVDVTDPRKPIELGHYRPEGFPLGGLQMHTVKPHPGLVNGKHVSLASVETFGGEASGTYFLLDTSDPRTPTLLSTWRLPGDLVNEQPLLWSPHEFSLANGRAFTSQFHGGVWVLDIEHFTLAPQAAWAKPDEPGPLPRWAVDVETAAWREGHVYAVDMGAGLLVLRPTR